MRRTTFPTREALQRLPFGLADVVLLLGVLALLALIARVGAGMLVSFAPPADVPQIDLNPANLPYYAARSTLRMFLALGCSFLFSLVYGYIAAKSRRAEQVLIPLLDVLQSVPVLGFLSITVSGFIALFPGSLLGLECASIFAIFTSQVWNMTFSFYHSLKTVPKELDEAATLYGFSRWQCFRQVELPAAMIPLLWNAVMSFGGGWFFVSASEAISVLNQSYTLPGIGSYVATAVDAQRLDALGWAILTIAIMIVLVDQLFWRPMVAWADKFKLEQSAAVEPPQSWLLDLLRVARLPRRLSRWLAPLRQAVDEGLNRLTRPRQRPAAAPAWRAAGDQVYRAVVIASAAALLALGASFVVRGVGWGEVGRALLLGMATFARVLVVVAFSTLIWVPVGVAIGFNPRLSRLLQPVVQFLSSFPANFLFPFATRFFIRSGVSINWGSILLMSLGAQWYILFNVIAGAQSVPTDLREMAANIGMTGWLLWKRLIIPAIFGAWVTGALTAAGGAWNASIVAELVSWGDTTLVATGLGAYIAEATAVGDWPRIVLGVGMMSLCVVGLNRLLWQPLYTLAEHKYRLG
jgi:NitT/TauT family transport system permease protein